MAVVTVTNIRSVFANERALDAILCLPAGNLIFDKNFPMLA